MTSVQQQAGLEQDRLQARGQVRSHSRALNLGLIESGPIRNMLKEERGRHSQWDHIMENGRFSRGKSTNDHCPV